MSKQLLVEAIVIDERLHDFGLPVPATIASAGVDLRAMLDDEKPLTLEPGKSVLVHSGLRVHIADPDYVGLIFPRSGLGHKHGIILGNCTGVIDADYTGPLMISLLNRTDEPVVIQHGDRVAQYVLLPKVQPAFNYVQEFTESSERGTQGFGHSGVK